ncbi:MAG: hypothetical protein ACLFWD_01180 [Anaerolineales bacterium]
MSESDGHGDFERTDVHSQGDYTGPRQQQGRAPLDEDANRERDVRHRERAVTGSDFKELAAEGFPKLGRVAVADAWGVAALVLRAWILTKVQSPRLDNLVVPTREAEEPRKNQRVYRTTKDSEHEYHLLDQEEVPDYDLRSETPSDVPQGTPSLTPASIRINLNADEYTIERGECTWLRWAVEHAEEVRLDGNLVGSTEAQEVCASETSGYTLLAENEADKVSEHLEIEVVEPSDDTRPAMGCIGYDQNGQEVCKASCGPNEPGDPCELE